MAPLLPQNGTEDVLETVRRSDRPKAASDRPTDWPPVHGDIPLLRKEVIQPHLPVRLPCYDFTPITDPTFDGSLPYGLGDRLRVLPTFVV